MPGLSGQRQSQPAPTGAAGASCYLWQQLTNASKLKKAAARNTSKGGGLVRLALVGSASISQTTPAVLASITSDHIPLACYTQGGQPEYVEWDGELIVSENFNILVAQFYDATDGDILALSHGVEI